MQATEHRASVSATSINTGIDTGTELCCPVIDLRQYTLYPGTRDRFIELFDRELVETQEATGMRVIGQFRDLGDPNRFVWMRGFADMPSRETGLNAFYVDSQTWKQHGEAARSCMIDSTDALLLHPVRPDLGFALASATQRPALASPPPDGIVVATIHHLPAPMDAAFLDFYESTVAPAVREAGGRLLGAFATEYSPNNFKRLPVREGEHVFAPFWGFADLPAYHAHMTALGRNQQWRMEIYPALVKRLHARPQILRLAPTSRSQLRA
jgi:NIPSNAP